MLAYSNDCLLYVGELASAELPVYHSPYSRNLPSMRSCCVLHSTQRAVLHHVANERDAGSAQNVVLRRHLEILEHLRLVQFMAFSAFTRWNCVWVTESCVAI